jgi:hypothetical protein
MKSPLIISFICLLLLSCNKKENTFDSLDFTIGGAFSEVYSLRLTQSDTIYIHQRWVGRRLNDSISVPKEKTDYYGILNQHEKVKLFNYIEKVNLFKYKSEYYEDYLDGGCYVIALNKGSKNKIIFVHSHNTPKEIDSIAMWINNIKQELKLKETKKKIEFTASGLVFPPVPPPPPIKNNTN